VKLLLLPLFFFSLLISSASGRKPAVEPVSGISIDHYKEVKPSQDPGFNFNDNPNRVPSNKVVPPKNYSTSSTDAEHRGSSTLPGIFFLISLAALPFGLWWMIINHKDEEQTVVSSHHDNTYDFMKEKETRSSTNNDDDDVKKAS
tara:strand:- start:47911 stop:48345 length:435 start_codon:yes stop_codon:yes gene_type:complete